MAEGRSIFTAVPLSPEAKAAVDELVTRVKADVAADVGPDARPVRWVRTDGIHVTLRFLGPTPADRFAGVERAVTAAAAECPPVRVRIHGAGGFPRPDRPRTLWLRIDEGQEGLATIARRLDDHLATDGWAHEARPFHAHLTLARADGVRAGPQTLRRLVAEAERLSFEFLADELVLFESVTGGGPARYEPLLRAPLTGEK